MVACKNIDSQELKKQFKFKHSSDIEFQLVDNLIHIVAFLFFIVCSILGI